MESSTSGLPTAMRAIIQKKPGGNRDDVCLELTTSRPVPQPRPDELLVRVHAVAINPCDWKMLQLCPKPGTSCGCDLAGVVAAVGLEAERMGFRVGERVATAVHGANPGDTTTGAFAEYVCCVAAVCWRVPLAMPWTTAAAIGGCGIGTAGLALFAPDTMGLKFPGFDTDDHHPWQVDSTHNTAAAAAAAQKGPYVLVYGGSTASGTMAMQLLNKAGYRPVATCSPGNFALATEYGAEACFDYKSATCVADVKAHTQGRLRYVLDCITDARSIATCEAALGRGGGRYVGLEALPADVLAGTAGVRTRSVRWTWVLAMSLIGRGEALPEPYHFSYSQERCDWGERWFHCVGQRLINDNDVRPHPVKVMPGGLEGVPDGVNLLQRGLVRGEKLVYEVCI